MFVLVCLYCFVSTALKTVTGRDILPFGKPVLQVSFLHSQGSRALWADARRATGVKAIAGQWMFVSCYCTPRVLDLCGMTRWATGVNAIAGQWMFVSCYCTPRVLDLCGRTPGVPLVCKPIAG